MGQRTEYLRNEMERAYKEGATEDHRKLSCEWRRSASEDAQNDKHGPDYRGPFNHRKPDSDCLIPEIS